MEHQETESRSRDQKTINVFVYGTLKSGYSNNHILRQAEHVMDGYVTGMALINTPAYPFAIEAADSSFAIGELYRVNEQEFENMDSLEGYPHYYDRKEVTVSSLGRITQTNEEHEPVKAWIYYIKNSHDKKSQELDRLIQVVGLCYEWTQK